MASIFDLLVNWWWQPLFAATVLFFVFVVYMMLESACFTVGTHDDSDSENESAARAAGKRCNQRRVEAFIIGTMIMGLAGALLAQHLRFIEPTHTFDPSKNDFFSLGNANSWWIWK